MSSRRTFAIRTEAEFDAFLEELIPLMIQVNPAAWPVTKIALDSIVRLQRLTLSLAKRPSTMYIIDEPDRLAWEEDSDFFGNCLIIQIPKP